MVPSFCVPSALFSGPSLWRWGAGGIWQAASSAEAGTALRNSQMCLDLKRGLSTAVEVQWKQVDRGSRNILESLLHLRPKTARKSLELQLAFILGAGHMFKQIFAGVFSQVYH